VEEHFVGHFTGSYPTIRLRDKFAGADRCHGDKCLLRLRVRTSYYEKEKEREDD
jgi:hypothetical protein